MKTQFGVVLEDIVSTENLFAAWREFLPGKGRKKDVQEFAAKLADNIIQLHADLANGAYQHGGYHAFNISDPKPRNIHKATVRDRVLHHAIYRKLYPLFDRTFIADSFSCRVGKGVHKALDRFRSFARKVSRNHTRTAWVLKCDIKKFFASIDHATLMGVLAECIPDARVVRLLQTVVDSFHSGVPGRGLPLGNLTSQLFCNVYMNQFDQFVKHKLRVRFYIRYADDSVFFSNDRAELTRLIPLLSTFLSRRLRLLLHPQKLFIRTVASGVDFLGWVHFPHHRVLRGSTRRRMFKRLGENPKRPTLNSYLGLIGHGDSFELRDRILNWAALWIKRS